VTLVEADRRLADIAPYALIAEPRFDPGVDQAAINRMLDEGRIACPANGADP
jgi:hypothetical protein